MIIRDIDFDETRQMVDELVAACVVLKQAVLRKSPFLKVEGKKLLETVLDRYEDKDFREVGS